MRGRVLLTGTVVLATVVGSAGLSGAAPDSSVPDKVQRRAGDGLARDFVPAVAQTSTTGRYFVRLREAPVAARVARAEAGGHRLSTEAQRVAAAAVRASQAPAETAIEASGGRVFFRYTRVANGFSAKLTPAAATRLAERPDVAAVEPVAIVQRNLASSVPFIGAPKVWKRLGATGAGIRVAVIDTGVDYTHKAFNGPGTVAAYERNDPTVVEPGTFPTRKVIGGFDFVGEDYDVLDDDQTNDVPRPDADPLDFDGHGTHTASTCCGVGVPGEIGKGVAPDAKIYAYRVWDAGSSTADVLVAGYERAIDPNQDGSTRDRVDVISFSGGVTFGTLSSTEAVAAQRVVDLGTVFVASAGNAGNQTAGGQPYVVGTPASARGVISVAASIDQLVAPTATVEDPAGFEFPEGGLIAHQDWSAPAPDDITAPLVDARELDPPADPSGVPAPTDRILCDATPAGQPLAGKIVLVFKGPAGEGDCVADDKAVHALEAGAIGVLFWDGFGGVPGQYAPDRTSVGIPAWSISDDDGAALGDLLSPDAPDSWNTGTVTITLSSEASVIPGFEDRMTDFTSEGPARLTGDLKPDVSAPGSDITAAGAGTGDGSLTISGTSMAAPHVSGVAALLLQLHPGWSPAQVKAAIMNQARTRGIRDVNGEGPVPATVMGAGRVNAFQTANATSLAIPGSLSFGLQAASATRDITRRFVVVNEDDRAHRYRLRATGRYSDFAGNVATMRLSLGGGFHRRASFDLGPGERQRIRARLTVDPSAISPAEQLFGSFFFNGGVDGLVRIAQRGGGRDTFHVTWAVTPLAASDTGTTVETIDLSGGPVTVPINGDGAGVDHADAYELGAEDDVESFGEEDITHVGARSFAGSSIDGVAEGLPEGVDSLVGLDWATFLENADRPVEPIEFGVRTQGIHNTTATLEVDVKIDVGADGVFADPELGADFLAVKTPGGGETCLFDLSLADPFAACAASYFPDYTNFNTNVIGVVVDAAALGLTDADARLAYQVTACTGTFAGDVPGQFCDSAGTLDETTGTYGATLNATEPALVIDPLVCGGFWGDTNCDGVSVALGSATAETAPDLLLLFPNNKAARTAAVVRVDDGA